MPEMKRTFQSGKMNRSEDERLVRPGEYREALNINIGRSETANIGAIENILGNVEISNSVTLSDDALCIGANRDNGNERVYFFVTDNNSDTEVNEGNHYVFMYDQKTGQLNTLVSGEFLNFHQNYLITGVNFVDDLLFWTDNRNEPRKINVTRALNDSEYYDSDDKAAVIKLAPVTPPTVTNVLNEEESEQTSSFLEEKFVRFAYRYKFNDGEFSTVSPFTPIVFKSITSDDLSEAYSSGQISNFINEVRQVFIEVQVPVNAGITGVEILYNESSTTTMYILEELAAETESSNDDPITVSYTYDSQDPFRALPGSQLTRVYDAVPRRALSQEFAGGRIIYGNYLRNYNLPSLSFQVETHTLENDVANPFNRFSVKSRRTYQVGIVLADKYGRQSPVILSSTGGDTIFVDALQGNDAMQQLEITFNNPDSIPSWAYSYRIVVKQRQQEYYNWFYPSLTSGRFNVTGNNVNKIPRDQTEETFFSGTTAIAQSDRKVYPKFSNGANFTGTSVLQVESLYFANDGNISAVVNDSGLGSTGVFETSPVESNLDIFYETSTAGLVEDLGSDAIAVDFYNCYILNVGGGHIELNRIRAGFNEQWLTVGLKAYATQENFAEERRFNTLIHSSGLFSSRVGQNNVNQFNEAEGGLTVSLDPADGSIQKLFAEDTQLIIFQEDKVSRSPIDKDFIYSAEGGAVPVTSSTQYLGTIAPYAGEYGISMNPESFSVYGTRKYFADKNRGAILRLSNDGMNEISAVGMADFFRDALASSTRVIGSFDEYHDQFNVTIVGNPSYSGFEDTNIATGSDGYFTVSFEEEVRGWTSFKSFKPEFGTTLNNRYYTINKGKLWEHNQGTDYNNFYGEDNDSYVEVIFNDAPSDVKEFKTINYEGKDGWLCDSVETEIEQLMLDPGSRDEAEVYTATINLSSNVVDGRVSGVESQTLLTTDRPKWIIKVSPSTPDYVVDSLTTATIEGVAITQQNVGSEVFLIYQAVDRTETDVWNAIIEGAASRDTSGAILIIRVINEIQEDELTVGIPTANNPFRGGANVLEYTSDDEDEADVVAEVRVIDEEGDNELNRDVFNVTYSNNLLPFFDEDTDPVETYSNTEYDYEREFDSLPSVQTNGTITFTTKEGADPLRHKAVVTLSNIVNNNSGNWTAYRNIGGTLIEFSSFEIAKIFTGTTTNYTDVFIVPDDDMVIGSNDDIAVSTNVGTVSFSRITGISNEVDLKPEDTDDITYDDTNFLLGSFKLTGTSATAVAADDRDDTSNDQDIVLTPIVTTAGINYFSLTYDNPSDDPDAGPVTAVGTTRVEDDVIVYSSANYRNVRYSVTKAGETDEVTTVGFNEGANSNIAPGTNLTVVVDDSADPGNYTVTFTPQVSGLYRGAYGDDATLTERTLTINVPTP